MMLPGHIHHKDDRLQCGIRSKKRQGHLRSHEQHLPLLVKLFVWLIRNEMLQEDVSQVPLYLNEMVKEKNFKCSGSK